MTISNLPQFEYLLIIYLLLYTARIFKHIPTLVIAFPNVFEFYHFISCITGSMF